MPVNENSSSLELGIWLSIRAGAAWRHLPPEGTRQRAAHAARVLAQGLDELLGQDRLPVLPSLAVSHEDLPFLEVDVLHLSRTHSISRGPAPQSRLACSHTTPGSSARMQGPRRGSGSPGSSPSFGRGRGRPSTPPPGGRRPGRGRGGPRGPGSAWTRRHAAPSPDAGERRDLGLLRRLAGKEGAIA